MKRHWLEYATVVVPLFALIALCIMIATLQTQLTKLGKVNSTYLRTTNCIMGIPVPERDQTKIDRCYDEVQKETGVYIKRYHKE